VGDTITVGDMLLQAQAKLNLTLEILGKRPDGYHDIESVVQSIDLCDRISLKTGPPVRVRRGCEGIDVKVTCNDTSIPRGRGNLAVDAACALAEFAGLRASMEINIEKRIPVAAGLGGGSADAAAVLVGLNHLWQLGLGASELMAVGERLGADIPFCVKGGTGIIRGKGEIVESLPTPDNLWFVVATLQDTISTAQAYARFDQLAETTGTDDADAYGANVYYTNAYDADVYDTSVKATDVTSRMVRAIKTGKAEDIAGGLTNALEQAAVVIVPSIVGVKQTLLAQGAVGVGMSGSGPTVFGLADSKAKADAIRDALKRQASSGIAPDPALYDSAPDLASCSRRLKRTSSGGANVSGVIKEVFVCQAVPWGVAYT
jgi:4-diphosphocytidyl-2-C-methyl-D-erythritol kinase